MNLKTGDIILVKGSGIVSEIIEGIERSKYSHAAIYIKNGRLIEAQGFKKTGYSNIDKYKDKVDIYRYMELTAIQRIKIIRYLSKQVGSHYDWLLLFWEALRYLFHVALPYKEYHSHICSTLVNDAYKSAEIDLCPGIKYPSPGDLANSKLLEKVSTF